MSSNSCTACIPTFRRPDCLNNALTSVLGCEEICEVLVAVTGEYCDSVNYISEHILEAMRICGKTVKVKDCFSGLIDAKSWFKKLATSDILLILDDDVVIKPSYMNLLKDFQDSRVGAVSGSMQTPCNIGYYEEWSKDELESIPQEPVNKIGVENGVLTLENKSQVYMFSDNVTLECDVLVGGAILIRKDLFFPDGNFQKEQCYFEEYDYTYAVKKRGFKVIFDTSEVAFHNRSNIGGMREFDSDKIEVKKQLTKYFEEKWFCENSN